MPQIGSGDGGKTALFSGRRVGKDDVRIEALGTIDELQSILGMVLSLSLEAETAKILSPLPHLLFDLSGEIAGEGKFVAENLTMAEEEKMENWIHKLDAQLPPLHEFILPGGSASAQWLNLARAVVRRAERRLSPLYSIGDIRAELFVFINRLSRLLFTLERWENFCKKGVERKWEKGKTFPEILISNQSD